MLREVQVTEPKHDYRSNSINALLIKALQKRLQELNTVSKKSVFTSPLDSEEYLRILMVKYYPKLNKLLSVSPSNQVLFEKIIRILKSLEPLAATELRFLDVFNNYYEVISRHTIFKKSLQWLVFLQSYSYALEKQIERMLLDNSRECCNQRLMTRKMMTFPSVELGMKVLVLADHFTAAARILAAINQIKDIEPHILICKNQSNFFKFLITQLVSVVYSAKFKLLLKYFVKKRVHFFVKPLHAKSVINWLQKQKYSIGLHAMGVIYRQEVINSFSAGILNSHIGVLPHFRGRSVLEWSLLTGLPTGVTVFFIDDGIDTGKHIIHRHLFSCESFSKIGQAKDYAFKLDGLLFKQAIKKLLSKNNQIELNEGGPRYYVMSQLFINVVNSILEDGYAAHSISR